MDRTTATELLGPGVRLFAPDYRGKFPHMFPRDIEVWVRFLDMFGPLYNMFAYDVRVGQKTWVFPRWETEYKKDAQILSQLRIDAVGFKDAVIDIIEVKPRFNSSAMGQILSYHNAFLNDIPADRPVRSVVVAPEIDPNITKLAKSLGIAYIKV